VDRAHRAHEWTVVYWAPPVGGLKGIQAVDYFSRMQRIAVFCGASSGSDPLVQEVARGVGRAIAARGMGVVYGGGR